MTVKKTFSVAFFYAFKKLGNEKQFRMRRKEKRATATECLFGKMKWKEYFLFGSSMTHKNSKCHPTFPPNKISSIWFHNFSIISLPSYCQFLTNQKEVSFMSIFVTSHAALDAQNILLWFRIYVKLTWLVFKDMLSHWEFLCRK